MQITKKLTAVLMLTVLLFSCKENNNTPTEPKTPQLIPMGIGYKAEKGSFSFPNYPVCFKYNITLRKPTTAEVKLTNYNSVERKLTLHDWFTHHEEEIEYEIDQCIEYWILTGVFDFNDMQAEKITVNIPEEKLEWNREIYSQAYYDELRKTIVITHEYQPTPRKLHNIKVPQLIQQGVLCPSSTN